MKRIIIMLVLTVLSLLLAGYSCSITAFQPEATASNNPSIEFDARVLEKIRPEWNGTAFETAGGQVGILVISKWWPSKPIDVSIWYADREFRPTSFREGTDVMTPVPMLIKECPTDELPGLIWTLVELENVVICVGEEEGKQRPFSGRDNLTEKEFSSPAIAEPQ